VNPFLKTLKQACLVFLMLLALYGLGVGIVGAVHPLNPRYWDGSNDFQWSPSRVLLEGTDPYALYSEVGPANNARVGNPFILSQWADYPPSSLMILWPLAVLPWQVAKWSWLIINLLSIGAIIWSLSRIYKFGADTEQRWLSPHLWFVVMFLACPSVCSTLKSGQHGLFSIAMFLMAVVACEEDRSGAGKAKAGILLAISWLKYNMTMPLSLFFLTRERRPAFIIAAASHLFATIFAGAWTNTSPLELLRGNLEIASKNLGLVAFDLSQTVTYIGLPGYVCLVAALSSVVLVAVFKAGNRRHGEVLCMLAFFSFVLLPHLRYDLFILVIPLAFALSRFAKGHIQKLILLSIVQLWFVREIAETLFGQNPKDPGLATISMLVIAVSVLLLYVPIVMSWLRLLDDANKESEYDFTPANAVASFPSQPEA